MDSDIVAAMGRLEDRLREAREEDDMDCLNCGDAMGGPATIIGRGYPHDHWNCESCGTEVTIPLPDSPDADEPGR